MSAPGRDSCNHSVIVGVVFFNDLRDGLGRAHRGELARITEQQEPEAYDGVHDGCGRGGVEVVQHHHDDNHVQCVLPDELVDQQQDDEDGI